MHRVWRSLAESPLLPSIDADATPKLELAATHASFETKAEVE